MNMDQSVFCASQYLRFRALNKVVFIIIMQELSFYNGCNWNWYRGINNAKYRFLWKAQFFKKKFEEPKLYNEKSTTNFHVWI